MTFHIYICAFISNWDLFLNIFAVKTDQKVKICYYDTNLGVLRPLIFQSISFLEYMYVH